MDKDVVCWDEVGFAADLLGHLKSKELGAGLEEQWEGEGVREQRWVSEQKVVEEGEGLFWVVGFNLGSDEGVVVRNCGWLVGGERRGLEGFGVGGLESLGW